MKHWIYSWRWVVTCFMFFGIFAGVECFPWEGYGRFGVFLGTRMVFNVFLIELFYRVFRKKYKISLICYIFAMIGISSIYFPQYVILHGKCIQHDNDILKNVYEYLFSIVPADQHNDFILMIIEKGFSLLITAICTLVAALSQDKRNDIKPCEQWNLYSCRELRIGRRGVYTMISLIIYCFAAWLFCRYCALWVATCLFAMDFVWFVFCDKDYVNEISEKKVVSMVAEYLYEQLDLPVSLNAFEQAKESQSLLFIEKAGKFFSWKSDHFVLDKKWEILLNITKRIAKFVHEEKYRKYLLFLLGLSFSVVRQSPERLLDFWEHNRNHCPEYEKIEVGVVTGVCLSINFFKMNISTEFENKLKKYEASLNEILLEGAREELAKRGNQNRPVAMCVEKLFPVAAACKVPQLEKIYYHEYLVKGLIDAHQYHLEGRANENA